MYGKYQRVFMVLVALALFAVGVAVRRHVLDAQRPLAGGELPFTLEGAIHFHRVQQVLEHGWLPVVDRNIEFPRGIRVSATDTVLDSYLTAVLVRCFPGSLPLVERLRWVEVTWFCLGIPLLALWVGLCTRSCWGGIAAGACYAVTLAAVIRSTGQELSHENFALPMLMASLVAAALAARASSGAVFWLSAAVSAALLALALMTWDLIQFYVLIWALWFGGRSAFGCMPITLRELWLAWLQIFALVLAAVTNPYLKAHGFLFSPPLLLMLGTTLASTAWRLCHRSSDLLRGWKQRLGWLLLALLPVMLGLLAAQSYGAAYGHFGELLVAKIRFLNVKPDDPALLTFNQRILWVPALHSATWDLTFMLFPAILLVCCIALACLALRKTEDRDSNLSQILTGLVVAFIGYWFFVRLHVFLVVFLAALVGWWAAWAGRRGPWARAAVAMAVLLMLAVETVHTVDRPEQYGRVGVYYRELSELTTWLRRNVAPESVLANFGVSAAILAYGDCPILLHPKFESPAIRERVQAYGEVLFKGTEEQFRDWAEREGALYYVHALGEFASIGVTQQMRYMVNALQPRADTPAWMFERAPQQLKLFSLVWGNGKYRVFRIHCRTDEIIAKDQAELAEHALQQGLLERAERHALEALMRAPQQIHAQQVLQHVFSLRAQGFGSGESEIK